jgi:hypothetical protein
MVPEVKELFARAGVDHVVEFMFDEMDRTELGRPDLGFDLDRPKQQKAVLMRRSAWNAHYPERNRPVEEWSQIEARVLSLGYATFVVGIDDDMSLTPGVVDRRRSMPIRELLEFTTDASLVVSCTTFLPVFTQFVCPSLVICDPLDYESQIRNWKVTPDYRVYAAREGYLADLVTAIPEALATDDRGQDPG